VFYNVPDTLEETSKHPNITAEGVARLFTLFKYWQAFVLSGIWFVLLACCYTAACMGSLPVLFFSTVWMYVPQEESQWIVIEALEQEQTSRRGRIRLER
jgi:hypothetical protein